MVGKFKNPVLKRTRAIVTTLPVSQTLAEDENRTRVQQSWEQAKTWFLENARREGQSPSSVDTREQRLSAFCKWAESQGIAPTHVTEGHVKKFIEYCQNQRLSPFTINGRLRVLKTFYAEGIADGIFEFNPAAKVKRLREPINTVIPLRENEVKALLSVFDRSDWVELRDFTIVTLLLDTGLRISEALNAKVDHLQINEHSLFIPPENAKGSRARTVYFGKQTARILREWLMHRGVDTDILFPSVYVDVSNTYAPLTRKAFGKRLRKYGERAGISHIHPHMLRHTFAVSYLVHSGGDLVTCSRQMGHSSVKTTERYLNVAVTEAQKKLVEQHSLLDAVGMESPQRKRIKRKLSDGEE